MQFDMGRILRLERNIASNCMEVAFMCDFTHSLDEHLHV